MTVKDFATSYIDEEQEVKVVSLDSDEFWFTDISALLDCNLEIGYFDICCANRTGFLFKLYVYGNLF